jgi:hypothetical protein
VGEALEVLCRSLNDEARLHWLGRQNVRNLIVTGLAEHLLLDQIFRETPELENQPLHSPLIITGLPRSGTTFLHRLLSAPPGCVGVPLHRHLFPTRDNGLSSRIEAEILFRLWALASRRYNLDSIHFVRPGLPDECNFGMRLGLQSMVFWSIAPTPSYLEWLLGQDLRETYRTYRRVLLLHQARHAGKQLVLKCPSHLAWLPALREALPEAHIIQTHRAPSEIVASDTKLVCSHQTVSTDRLDWRSTVVHNQHKLNTFARRATAFADTDAGQSISHISYSGLVRDPLAVTRQVRTQCGLDHSEADEAAMAAYVTANRQHKHGTNPYSLDMFQLDRATIDRDFHDYHERFLSTAPLA